MFDKSVLSSLNTIAKYNMKYVDKIVITMYNPSTQSMFRPMIYESNIVFKKSEMYIYKDLKSNHLDDLMIQIKNTLENEVKL